MKRGKLFSILSAFVFAFGSAAMLPADFTAYAEAKILEAGAVGIGYTLWSWRFFDDGTLLIAPNLSDDITKETDSITIVAAPSPNEIPEGEGIIPEFRHTSYYEFLNNNPDYKITKLIIGEGTTAIKEKTFFSGTELEGNAYYRSITSVSLPNTLKCIGASAFQGCTSLKEVNIPESVTQIGTNAFAETPWYQALQAQNGYIVFNHILFDSPAAETAVIPDGVTVIAPHAVSQTVHEITLPESLTRIERSAFQGCTALTALKIPANVTEIGADAFSGCTKLAAVDIPETLREIGCGAFAGTKWLTDRQAENPFVTVNGVLIDGTACKGDITIPDGIDRIGCGAFAGNADITSAVIPESVTALDEAAFLCCQALKSITFPNSISRIPTFTCGHCPSLTDIHYSDSIQVIGAGAFFACSALTDFTIPATIMMVELAAFYKCDRMTKVTFLNPYCCFYHLTFTFGNNEIPFDYSEKKIGTVCGYNGSIAEEFTADSIHRFESLGDIPDEDFPKPPMYGDVTLDRNLDIADAVLLARFLAEDTAVVLTEESRLCADTNASGTTDLADVTEILRRIAKLETPPLNQIFVYDYNAYEKQDADLDEIYFSFANKFPIIIDD